MHKSKKFCTFAVAKEFRTMARGKRVRQALKKVRITAVRQTVYPDLMAQYENPIEHACTIHEGQEWVSIDAQCPEGLCAAAWASMREFVVALAHGKGNFYDGWMKNPMSAMISCNDGFRPFSFYIEVIDEPKASTLTDTVNLQQPKLKRMRGDAEWRVQQLVLVLGKQSLPRRQILAELGMKQGSRRSLIDHYIRPAYAQGYIAFAYPSSPNKPEQAYKLTAKGLELLAKLKEKGE